MSNLPYRYPVSISHVDIGSYLVTLLQGGRGEEGQEANNTDGRVQRLVLAHIEAAPKAAPKACNARSRYTTVSRMRSASAAAAAAAAANAAADDDAAAAAPPAATAAAAAAADDDEATAAATTADAAADAVDDGDEVDGHDEEAYSEKCKTGLWRTARQMTEGWFRIDRTVPTGVDNGGRGLHSSTFQLNPSRFCQDTHPKQSLLTPGTP